MYLILKSTDSVAIFPNNNASHFNVHLSQPLCYQDYLSCALIQLSYPQPPSSVKEILVVTNCVIESCVGDTLLPVTNRLIFDNTDNKNTLQLQQAIYLPLKSNDIDILEVILIERDTLRPVKLLTGITYCTLHFLEV